MEELEYRGEWWLADENEEDRVGGILEFDPDEGGNLELIGSFGDFGSGTFGEYDLIKGHTTDGKIVTLQDCYVNQSGLSGTMQTQSVSVQKVFTGVQFSDGDLELDKVCLSFPLLEMWTATNIIGVPDGQMSGAEIGEFDEIEAELENANIRLNITPSQMMNRYEGMEITQQAYFCIEPDEPLTVSEFINDYIRHLQHFVCLAIGEPVNPTDVKGYFEHGGETERIQISYQVSDLPEVPNKKHPHKLQFNLRDIDFEEAIQNWFEDAEGAEMTHNLYFGTQYNKTMFEENKFLSLVIALESYQSYLFPDHRLMDEDEYSELHDDILDMIPDDAEAKGRIDDLLGSIGNKGSLGDQLEMVFYEHEEILEDLIDMNDVIQDAKNGRHTIAHGLEREYDVSELGDTARLLQVVIEAIFLNAVGLGNEFVKEKLTENRKYILNQ